MTEIDLRDIGFNISNYCLGSCKHCTLWKQVNWHLDEQVNLRQIEHNLLADPLLDHLTTIHLTGGSPYLQPKFIPLCKLISEYHPNVPVNSPLEGLFPRLYERVFQRVLKYIPHYRVDLALEGASQGTHEKIRGKGSWEPVWETLTRLKNLGMSIQFEMTVYHENYNEIVAVAELAKTHNVGLYINFGRYSRRFGHSTDGIMKVPEKMVYSIEEQLVDIGWLGARPLNQQKWKIQKAMWLGKKVSFDCLMGIESIDIQPQGEVYPCLMYPENMGLGNIKEASITELSQQPQWQQQLEKVAEKRCQPCPFTCVLHIRNLVIKGENS